jgi:uncharacterized protein (TIGR01244 family)
MKRLLTILCVWAMAIPVCAQETPLTAVNFLRISSDVCTAGQPSMDDLVKLKSQGVRSIINLRRPSEFNAEEETAKARELGLRYVNIPVDGTNIQDAQVAEFLRVTSDPENRPMFIHCTTANRVGGFWMIRRVLVDHWPLDQAEAEGRKVGLHSQGIIDYAKNYIARQQAAEELKSIRNYARVADDVHIGAQPRPEQYDKLKAAGVKVVLNLRTPEEHRAAEEEAQAQAAGLKYINIPMKYTAPQESDVDEFLRVMDDPANRPVYIHCTTTIRVAALWMIRRVLREGIPLEQAEAEAMKLGLATGPDLRDFARAYIAKHKK